MKRCECLHPIRAFFAVMCPSMFIVFIFVDLATKFSKCWLLEGYQAGAPITWSLLATLLCAIVGVVFHYFYGSLNIWVHFENAVVITARLKGSSR